MLPRDTTKRQLQYLRKITKGKDIGDLTVNDRLNKNLPNLQYIGNPIDTNIESWEEFSQKDSQLQTIAFKSKLVNKPLVKENKKEIMKEKLENIISFKDFEKNWKPEEAVRTKRTEVAKDILKEAKEKQPEYTMLGQEKEPKSNPLYGYSAVRDREIRKIAWFDNFTMDPPTPKERPILNAGQFIHTDKVRGYINRIDGKDIYIETMDDPLVIKKFNIKDAIRPEITPEEEIPTPKS